MNPFEPERAAGPPRAQSPPSPPPAASEEPGEAASPPSAEVGPTDPGEPSTQGDDGPEDRPGAEPASDDTSTWPWFGPTDSIPPHPAPPPAPEPARAPAPSADTGAATAPRSDQDAPPHGNDRPVAWGVLVRHDPDRTGERPAAKVPPSAPTASPREAGTPTPPSPVEPASQQPAAPDVKRDPDPDVDGRATAEAPPPAPGADAGSEPKPVADADKDRKAAAEAPPPDRSAPARGDEPPTVSRSGQLPPPRQGEPPAVPWDVLPPPGRGRDVTPKAAAADRPPAGAWGAPPGQDGQAPAAAWGAPPQAQGGQSPTAWSAPPQAPGGPPPGWGAPPRPPEGPMPSVWDVAPIRPEEQAPRQAPSGNGAGAPAQWGVVAPPAQPGWQAPPPGWGLPGPSTRRSGGRRGLLLVGGSIALVVALLLVGLVARPRGAPAPARRPQAGRATNATQFDPQAAANRILSARARAILAKDKAGFLAAIDRRRTAFYLSQSRLFDNLATVPFQDFNYRLVDPQDDLASANVRHRYAPARVYLPEAEARYRFRGHDGSPVLSRFYYTFVQTPVGWRIAAQGEAKPTGVDDVEIWDAGPLRTAVTQRTLVVYHPGNRLLAERMLRAAERAYAQIDTSWSGPWEHRVVILVPHDQNEAQRLVGGTNLSKVAAVASSSIEAGPVERVLGNRVVVNTSNIANYDNLNLQVVTTHEMTHVATRTLGSGEPLYLVEGFADYTALRPIAQPLTVTRPALAKKVAQGRFNGQLPSDDAFRAVDAAAAYDEASSFCLWVATTFGNARLQALFRAFAGSQKPTLAQQDAHFQQVLGMPLRTARARWAAWVQRQL